MRRFMTLMASSLVLGCLALSGLAGLAVGSVLDQYPGSVRLSGPRVNTGIIRDGLLRQESVYETRDAFGEVEAWYKHRLHLEPSTKLHKAGGCQALGQSAWLLWIDHSEFVLICATPYGTRVVVRHRVALLLP